MKSQLRDSRDLLHYTVTVSLSYWFDDCFGVGKLLLEYVLDASFARSYLWSVDGRERGRHHPVARRAQRVLHLAQHLLQAPVRGLQQVHDANPQLHPDRLHL